MRMKARAGLWLTALGLALAPPARSAVMTGNVVVSSGAAPYSISYILAQQAATMTVKIHKASDGSVIRTINNADISPEALVQGVHTGGVTWDGKTDGGATAPVGTYYAEIITTGDQTYGMTELAAPGLMRASLNGVNYNDGRAYYDFGTIVDPNSPWHNDAVIGTISNGNAGQTGGVQIMYPNATSGPKYFNNLTTPNAATNDWISAAGTSDGKIALFGQSSGQVKILNPDGTTYKTLSGTNQVKTRSARVSGTADAGTAVFVDIGGTGGQANAISMISLAGTTAPTSTVLVPASLISSGLATRNLAVRFDSNNQPTAIWTTTWGPGVVKKFIPPPGGGTPWVLDTAFTYKPPVDFGIEAPTNVFVGLSRDGNTLYVAGNKGNTTDKNYVESVNANTGASNFGNGDVLLPTWAPQSIAVTTSGNLYITNYTGNITGTTADRVAVVAPMDNGSSDTTRSFDFLITSDTQIKITDLQVTNVSYHGAKITWTTNYPTDTTLSYGTTAGAPDKTVTDSELTTSHSVTLENLASGTKFYFTAKSTATGLDDGVSPETSFTTTTLTVSNVQVTQLSDTSAVVTFNTSEPGLGIVRYSRTSGGYMPGSATTDARHPGEISVRAYVPTPAPLSTTHSVTLTGLSPNTKYYFVAESGLKTTGSPAIFSSAPTYAADSPEMTLQTLNSIELTTASLTATTTGATLNFTTNPASAAVVKWGAAPDALTNTVNVASGTTHTAQLTGLSAGTTYYYTIDLSAAGAASRTTPVATLVTAVTGGTASTVTHGTAADLKPSTRSQIVLGGSAGLVSLEKQGIPDAPVAGTDLPAARYYEGVVAYNGYLYSIGGLNSAGASTANVYVAPINSDGSFGAWTETTALPSNRYLINNQCVAYGGYIYVVAGAGGTAAGNVVYYAQQNADGTLGTWQTTSALPVDKDLASVVAVDGAIYLGGGETASDDQVNDVYKAEVRGDGSLGAWTKTSSLKDALYLQRSVANAHRIYTYAGLTDSTAANYALADINTVDIARTQPVYALTPYLRNTDDLGQTAGTMDSNLYSGGAGLLRGQLVLAGGRQWGVDGIPGSSSIISSPINADGSAGPWSSASYSLPAAVRDNDAAAYNGVLYVGPGRSAAGAATAVATFAYVPFMDQANTAGATYAYSGNLDSKIMDLGALSNLKHLKVTASGSGVEVRYRFANEDGVFTPYLTPSSLDADISGAARYFQYQLVLTGNGTSTPVVNSVALTTQAVAPGTFTKTDVENALKAAGGLVTLSAQDKTRLDVDGDGSVTVKDAVAINRQVNLP